MTTIKFQVGGKIEFVTDDEPKIYAIVTVRYENFSVTARGDGMAYKLPSDHQVTLKVEYVDQNGNPATIDGEVTWDSSNEDIATVEADSSDSAQCTVRPGTQIGMAQISATVDADLGDGVRELITTLDVDVVGGEAVAGTITPTGSPTPIEPPAEPRRR